MDSLQALILGLIQGLTEFLPVSSSGHLTIGKALFGMETGDLSFEVAVHAATVLATILAFRKEIAELICGLFKFKYNSQTDYIAKIIVSMIPVGIVGVFFKDAVEAIFGEGVALVGIMLALTAALLCISELSMRAAARRNAGKDANEGRSIGFKEAFIIGCAQAIAVLPGLSRSGSTIATGLILGVKKSEVAKFSFLMVIVPILGEAFLDLVGGDFSASAVGTMPLMIGFVSAFVSGYAACKWMISIVRKAHLWGFAIYCALVGSACIISSIL